MLSQNEMEEENNCTLKFSFISLIFFFKKVEISSNSTVFDRLTKKQRMSLIVKTVSMYTLLNLLISMRDETLPLW